MSVSVLYGALKLMKKGVYTMTTVYCFAFSQSHIHGAIWVCIVSTEKVPIIIIIIYFDLCSYKSTSSASYTLDNYDTECLIKHFLVQECLEFLPANIANIYSCQCSMIPTIFIFFLKV